MADLTPEEEKVLKEFAQNLLATSRIGRLIKMVLIWLATSIGAGTLIWEFLIKGSGKN